MTKLTTRRLFDRIYESVTSTKFFTRQIRATHFVRHANARGGVSLLSTNTRNANNTIINNAWSASVYNTIFSSLFAATCRVRNHFRSFHRRLSSTIPRPARDGNVLK